MRQPHSHNSIVTKIKKEVTIVVGTNIYAQSAIIIILVNVSDTHERMLLMYEKRRKRRPTVLLFPLNCE
jgi:hypothetical protein